MPSPFPRIRPGINGYGPIAEGYAASNETSFVHAYYERPAMLALVRDVVRRRVLDAGCGSGPLLAALRDRGAIVTGFDKSTGMLEVASSPTISRPTTTSPSGPWTARARCCVSGPGRCTR